MNRLAIAAALSTLLCFGPGAARAQQQEATPPGGGLSMGQAMGPQVGQVYARETHGDWQMRCVKAPEGQVDPCTLYQRMADQQGNPTGDMNFFVPPPGAGVAGGATLLTPLRSLLTEGVTMVIDDSEPRRYPYSFCDEQGCYARLGFTEAEMQLMRNGTQAQIRVVPAMAPDQAAILTLSLSGFTAGMQAIGAVAQEIQAQNRPLTAPSLGGN